MNRLRQKMTDTRQAGKEGRRYHAFYQGYHARRTSRPANPFKPGSDDHRNWQAGWQHACDEEAQS